MYLESVYSIGLMDQQFSIVATPIGNRDDITTRALQVLGDMDFIVAEDTRHTGQLLSFYGIKKPMISFRDAPMPVMQRSLDQIGALLDKGECGAYVTDAGTPGVSDPAWRLVAMLQERGIAATPVPGPSAVTALISVAHVPIDEYRFLGFLPKKKGYQTKIEDMADYLAAESGRAVMFYESPNRIRKTLNDVLARGRARDLVFSGIIGRELTKKFETIYRDQLTEAFISQLPEKGEYAVCIYLVSNN